MAEGVYYRDSRNPREVHGPYTARELRDLADKRIVRPLDQVSLDGRSWLLATEYEPDLFPGQSTDGFAPAPAWRLMVQRAVNRTKVGMITVVARSKEMATFYWSHRNELRDLAGEYITFLKQPGGRREIRVAADDGNESVFLAEGHWHADLPDCCVVCGEPADCDWNSEQRAVPNLTASLLGPVIGLCAGIVGWIFFGPRWLVLAGLVAGFLIGYWQRGETIVAVRFRRCREHLNRTKYPALRIFHKTLIIGVGDRKVWRRFFYGDRDLETPMAVPPSFTEIVEKQQSHGEPGEGRPSYPTIPLASDDEETNEPHL